MTNHELIALLEITAGQELTYWVDNLDNTWTAVSEYYVLNVFSDGAELDISEWDWEPATGEVTIIGVDPSDHFIQATVGLYFTNKPLPFSTALYPVHRTRYDPRIISLPNVSRRISEKFGGVIQIGGCDIQLANADGFFDQLIKELDFDAGTAVLKISTIDTPLYSEFTSIGTWCISGYTLDFELATLELKDLFEKIELKVPVEVYSYDTYPNLEEAAVGEAIPLAYGRIHNISPVLIDTTLGKYKVAGHAIHSFDGITGGEFDSQDTANGEFILANFDPEALPSLQVSFTGKALYNPADVLADLLADYTLDTASFTEAYEEWHLGTNAHSFEVSLYIDEATELLEICSNVAEQAHGILYLTTDGEYALSAWYPKRSEDLPVFIDEDLISVKETGATNEINTSITAAYVNSTQLYIEEANTAQYRRRLPVHYKEEKDFDLDLLRCVRSAASLRLMLNNGVERTWAVELSRRALFYNPGDAIYFNTSRGLLNGNFEILEISTSLDSPKVSLVLSNWHGLNDYAGYWAEDTPLFPSYLGGGSCEVWSSAWTTEQKKWARENLGYWTDDNGFIDSDDPESYLGSVWI